jgi:hypothetical protein
MVQDDKCAMAHAREDYTSKPLSDAHARDKPVASELLAGTSLRVAVLKIPHRDGYGDVDVLQIPLVL